MPSLRVVTPEPQKVITIAQKNGIDSQEVGQITQMKGIKITNKGYNSDNEPILDF